MYIFIQVCEGCIVVHFEENISCPTCKINLENPTTPMNCVKPDPLKQAIVNNFLNMDKQSVSWNMFFLCCDNDTT